MDRAGQSRMRQQMVSWLGNAHAMEMQALQLLDNQSRRIEATPTCKSASRTSRGDARTGREGRALHRALRQHASRLKDAGAMFIGNMQALGGAFMPDEVVKGSIMSYVFEHLEIACFRSLIGAAEELGDDETAEVCTEILREEAMAGWLEERLSDINREVLRRQRAGQHAKR